MKMQCYAIFSASDLELPEHPQLPVNTVYNDEIKIKKYARFLAFKNESDAFELANKVGTGSSLYLIGMEVNLGRQEEPAYSTCFLTNQNPDKIKINKVTKISGPAIAQKKPSNLFFQFKNAAKYIGTTASGFILGNSQTLSQMQCTPADVLHSASNNATASPSGTTIPVTSMGNHFHCTIASQGILPHLSLPNLSGAVSYATEHPWLLCGGATAITLSVCALAALAYRSYTNAANNKGAYDETLENETRKLNQLSTKLRKKSSSYEPLLTRFDSIREKAIHQYKPSPLSHAIELDLLAVTRWERERLSAINLATGNNKQDFTKHAVSDAKAVLKAFPFFERSNIKAKP